MRQDMREAHNAWRFSDRRPVSNWSAINVLRFNQLFATGTDHASELAAFESRGRVVPEDAPAEMLGSDLMQLQADAAAWPFFERQPAGWRRQARWYVLGARSEATRQRRLSRIIQLSATGKRLPGYG
jgi:hypothetical protein